MAIFKLTKRDRNDKMREVGSIEIKNQTEESADLCFFGDINSESLGEWQKYYPEDKAPQDVKDFLDQLNGVSKINVHINSGGGSVFGGIAIYNMLKRFDAEKVVYVEGLAASIASVIAMAGDKIIIPANAQMMIHKPSSCAWGNADDMRKEADVLDGCQKVILNTYMQHAKDGVTEDQINDLINAETWKNGEEWQQYFDIEISESSQAVAAASDFYDSYKNLPEKYNKQADKTENMVETIANAVIDAINEKLNAAQQQPNDDYESQAAAILEDLDYI